MAEREILFRGKRKDNGEWITDSETYIRDGDGIWLSDENLDVAQVIPETFGQFTGLTDNYNERIFEGDIVETYDGIYAIIWDNRKALFYLRNPIAKISTGFYQYFSTDLEVIGNIHDNPELLQKI